ncbi:MAG: phosphoribosyltransferase [Tenacibaculum sp.]
MEIVKLHDLYFKKLISKNEIASIVKKLALQVKSDLPENEVPIFVGILNGCFVFVSDFIREYRGNCEISFVKLASYQNTKSTEKIKKLIGINENLTNRTVIVLEDIIDTGTTLCEVYKILKTKTLKELKIVSLFFKPNVYKKQLPIHYTGKSIPDAFIVGYGLDYNGYGRNLPAVYQLTKNL